MVLFLQFLQCWIMHQYNWTEMQLDNDAWFIMESCLIFLVISFIIHGLLLLVDELLIHDSYWMIQIHDQLWLSISTVDSDDLCFMSYVLCHMFCAMIWCNMLRYDMMWYDSNDTMISDFLIHDSQNHPQKLTSKC